MKRKSIRVLSLTLALVLLFAVPVAAQVINFSFNTDTADDADDEQFSANALKEDDLDYAFVRVTDSNITSYDNFTFCVVGQKGDSSSYSQEVQATAQTGVYNIYYNRDVYNGNNYRLRGRTYAYYVHAEGRWEP